MGLDTALGALPRATTARRRWATGARSFLRNWRTPAWRKLVTSCFSWGSRAGSGTARKSSMPRRCGNSGSAKMARITPQKPKIGMKKLTLQISPSTARRGVARRRGSSDQTSSASSALAPPWLVR